MLDGFPTNRRRGKVARTRAKLAQTRTKLEEATKQLSDLGIKYAGLQARCRSQAELNRLADVEQARRYVDTLPAVLQYRQAYFEITGKVPPGAALPEAHAHPLSGEGISYTDKLSALLPLEGGRGAEIGPLNVPILTKPFCNVLYVDHLDTDEIIRRNPAYTGIVPIDRPMMNRGLADTLAGDAPVDYILGSQVLEHVPDPILWLQEAATVLRAGGLLSLSLPDRRLTFDLMREESRSADLVAAHFERRASPGIREVYDHHSLAAFINMAFVTPLSVLPEEVIGGRGAVRAPKATADHLSKVDLAKSGEYLDVHCWVFTPPSFLLAMAQLADDGFLPFRCRQFYPTDPRSGDRGSSSFVVIMEKVLDDVSPSARRLSFLAPLGAV